MRKRGGILKSLPTSGGLHTTIFPNQGIFLPRFRRHQRERDRAKYCTAIGIRVINVRQG